MPIVDELRGWIDTLALLLLRRQETRRARRRLIVVPRDEAFVVYESALGQEPAVGTFSADHPVPDQIARAAHQGLVVFELPPENVVVSRISVPSKATGFLDGVIRNQIDRLSPWRANEVTYGYSAEPDARRPNMLDVRVFVAPTAMVEGIRQKLTSIGLSIDRIVTRNNSSHAIVIWSQLADHAAGGLHRARRLIKLGVCGCGAISLIVSLWAFMSARSIQERSDELVARSGALQRQLQRSAAVPAALTIDAGRSAWHLKEMSPSAAMTLENLSRALPDVAYLKELDLQQDVVRISGLTSDAPPLITALEESGYFTDVHFFAPTTRAPDGKFSFYIEGRVKALPGNFGE
jgi:general secretion pathway protein L